MVDLEVAQIGQPYLRHLAEQSGHTTPSLSLKKQKLAYQRLNN